MADVDEVTKDPHKAYTLYVGMPYNDAVANFKHLSGWQFYEEWKYFAFFSVKEDNNKLVKECVCVEFDPNEESIFSWSIYFLTDNFNIADNIYKRICKRLEENPELSFGQEYKFTDKNPNYTEIEKVWYLRSNNTPIETGKIEVSIQSSPYRDYGYGMFLLQTLPVKAKYAVSIDRFRSFR